MKKKIKYPKNFGVIEDPRSLEEKARDFVFGQENGLAKIVLNTLCNWMLYFGDSEPQYSRYSDFMDCVSESLHFVVEIILNLMISLGMILQENIDWLKANGYYGADNKVHLSVRHLAKMSGTTKLGNYQWKVADTARHFGFIPESKWPSNDMEMSWDEYYKEILQELVDLGVEFSKRFIINYEFVYTTNHDLIKQSLQYSPMQVLGYAWPKPVNDIYPASPNQHNHAFVSMQENFDESLRYIKDSYPDYYSPQNPQPYYKKLAWDYIFGSQGVVVYINAQNTNQINLNAMEFINTHQNKLIQNTKDGQFGIIVGDKLLVADKERAGQLALTALTRNGFGLGITDELWESLPKQQF